VLLGAGIPLSLPPHAEVGLWSILLRRLTRTAWLRVVTRSSTTTTTVLRKGKKKEEHGKMRGWQMLANTFKLSFLIPIPTAHNMKSINDTMMTPTILFVAELPPWSKNPGRTEPKNSNSDGPRSRVRLSTHASTSGFRGRHNGQKKPKDSVHRPGEPKKTIEDLSVGSCANKSNKANTIDHPIQDLGHSHFACVCNDQRLDWFAQYGKEIKQSIQEQA